MVKKLRVENLVGLSLYINFAIQVQKKLLRIREARLKDTGFLTCKGINGFGSVTVRVELLVSDPRHGLPPVFSEAFLAPSGWSAKRLAFPRQTSVGWL